MALNFFSKLLTMARPTCFLTSNSLMHTMTQTSLTGPTAGGAWSLLSVRTNIRNHFPRARETKRIKIHGWKTRMSTKDGQKVIMRRILKGRHVLSH